MRSDETLLLDILIASRKIKSFLEGFTRQKFETHIMAQSAVTHEIQIIGEAVKLLSAETKTKYSDIQWHKASGMRNRIVHKYFDVDLDIIWDTAQNDIIPLIEKLEKILPLSDDDKK